MNDSTRAPPSNVVQFRSEERARIAASCGISVADSWDHGPAPEESLRMMRAFVGIKNRKLREDMIEMLEGASRVRGQAPVPAKD